MEIKVTGCGDCPFCETEYDSESIGFDTYVHCVISRFLNYNYKGTDINKELYKDSSIDAYCSYDNEVECDYCSNFEYYNDDGTEAVLDQSQCKCEELRDAIEVADKTPTWCPLRNNIEFNIIKK